MNKSAFRPPGWNAERSRSAFETQIPQEQAECRTSGFRPKNSERVASELRRDIDVHPAQRSSSIVGAKSLVHVLPHADQQIQEDASLHHPPPPTSSRAAFRF